MLQTIAAFIAPIIEATKKKTVGVYGNNQEKINLCRT